MKLSVLINKLRELGFTNHCTIAYEKGLSRTGAIVYTAILNKLTSLEEICNPRKEDDVYLSKAEVTKIKNLF